MTVDSATMKRIRKTLVMQQDQADCGLACLLSLIRYYGGNTSLENLRRLSGSDIQGTTLLGLYEAANRMGFTAEGCTADMEALKNHSSPVILHTIHYDNLQHYIVCFGYRRDSNESLRFIIGDPARGLEYVLPEELAIVWKSRACLTLTPNNNFVTTKDRRATQRQWMIRLLRKDYPVLLSAVGMGIAVTILGLTMAVFTQTLVDDILPEKRFGKLFAGIALVVVMLLAKEGLSACRQYLLALQAKDFNIRITSLFYRQLLMLPKSFFDTRKTGELIARLHDTSRIQDTISRLAGSAVIDLLMILAGILFLISYAAEIGIAVTALLPLLYLLIYRHHKSILHQQRDVMSNYAVTESNYISTLQGIASIKSHNKQTLFSDNNQHIYKRYQEAVFGLEKIRIRLQCKINSFAVLLLCALMLYGSMRVLNSEMTIGELIATLTVCGAVLPAISNLALISIPLQEAAIAFGRMFEFSAAEPETDRKDGLPIAAFQSLKATNLSFRFPGKKRLLHNVSFEVSKGEIIAIMGENGSGKSTLTQIAQRHYHPESGLISVDEQPIDSFQLADWRKFCAVVPQQVHVFNSTVLENIAYEEAALQPQQVMHFLDEMNFGFFTDSLPQSVMTLAGEEGVNLSGGQKQMMALARALYTRPQLLILDEATSAMDRDYENFVLNVLQRLKPTMAIIFITHRLQVLKKLCDRIYVLEKGTITAVGNHDQLLRTTNPYSSYWSDLSP